MTVFLESAVESDEAELVDVDVRVHSVEAFGDWREIVKSKLGRQLPLSLYVLSGMPFHFELTFGTFAGSFCCETAASLAELVLFRFAFCFSCSAYFRKAACDGSFNVRANSLPRLLFFSSWGSCGVRSGEPVLSVAASMVELDGVGEGAIEEVKDKA